MKKYLFLSCLTIVSFCLITNICSAATIKIVDLNTNREEKQLQPYGDKFYGAINVATGDFNGDGQKEIATAPGQPGKQPVRFFSAAGGALAWGFFPWAEDFRGGINLASGDVNGDGQDELLVVPENQAAAEIKIYQLQDDQFQLLNSFTAFPAGFTGGASLACFDLDHNGQAEIIAGAGPNGAPQVRIFDSTGKVLNQFLALAENFRGGVNVTAGNVNQDAFGEIIIAPRQGAPHIRVFDRQGKLLGQFYAFDEKFRGGSSLALTDPSVKQPQNIIIGTYKGAPQIRIFDAAGQVKKQFFAFDQTKRHGTRQASLGQKLIVAQGKDLSGVKKIALTFDDGYCKNGSFDSILNTLKANNVPATFFMLGKVGELYATRMRRIVAEGHLLANHSYTHAIYTRIPESQMIGEIITTERILKNVTGVQTKHFRFPGGGHNQETNKVVEGLGYRWYQWNISTGDSATPSPTEDAAYWNVVSHLRNNGNVLMHTQSRVTANILNRLISAIKKAGYEFVTVEDLDYYNI